MSFMSNNANLLDMKDNGKVGRFVCYFLAESAAMS